MKTKRWRNTYIRTILFTSCPFKFLKVSENRERGEVGGGREGKGEEQEEVKLHS